MTTYIKICNYCLKQFETDFQYGYRCDECVGDKSRFTAPRREPKEKPDELATGGLAKDFGFVYLGHYPSKASDPAETASAKLIREMRDLCEGIDGDQSGY